ncbi:MULTISPECIES: cytochrome P450 family protein [Streptomyces]|uniref:Cytochrome P450 n=1 Tax=Streptomyces griseiscabiei TaxID=2993540 RepID=A0ABU4LEB8_9ACTN|nr:MULTISPECIES: cytochrome P450 [Streptomyces]MBZ3908430.1 cytochrome P450 [Streptomyces griseiscabiei]MDX2913948.1 cytochrome P450 [Streptomyces griseiscabiei]
MSTSAPAAQAPAGGCPYRLDATGSDIHGEAAALRVLGPATRVLLPGDIPAWSVTDPHLIRRLLTHPDISKDASRHWPAYHDGTVPTDWPLRIWVDVRNALSAYGDEHRRLRRPLAAAFSTRRVRALVPQIEAITHALLDDLQHAGPEESVDLRARFAWRLPLLVVNAVLGVPEDLHDDFRDAIGALFATDLTPEDAEAAPVRVYELIAALLARKRAKPGDDVTSGLISAHDDGQLSEQELADSLVLLIGAGHETTVNLLDHAVTNLLTHPDQLNQATTGRIGWEHVVEETLRHQAPIATIILRFAVCDVLDEATGITFAAGDALAINYAAAGRDTELHGADADEFDINRAGARDHLAFGHGPHLCLGAELARIEARIALEALFTRFPRLRLAVTPDQLQPLPSLISNGHQQLPVHLGTPAA